MISREHCNQVCRAYDLGEMIGIEEISEGVLNHNYILKTSRGIYFIKSVRKKKKGHLHYIHNVETFMESGGIPAISMLKTQSGEIYLTIDDAVCTLYPYLESDRTHQYSTKEYRDMGKLLAQIHIRGQLPLPDIFLEKKIKPLLREEAIEHLHQFKEKILLERNPSDKDLELLSHINLKLEVIPTLKDTEIAPNDTLIHGDFHVGNLLVDRETREILGVCDWEQALMAPRAYELARSVMYIAWEGNPTIETAVERGQEFVSGYHSVFPITFEELRTGVSIRLERMLYGTWIEEGYLLYNDDRGTRFIPNEGYLITTFIKKGFDLQNLFRAPHGK